MHASLAESLENLKPGLLWVARDGTVRYADGEGTARTGLATGRRLHDPDLLRAVAAAIVGRVPRQVAAVGVSDTGKDVSQELRCRVIPGLASDDAFVLIGHDVTHDDGVGYDSLMQVIRADVRDPLRDAEKALSLWESQDTGGPELATMAQRLRALLGVVDRLVDLASIWDCSALQATDRIELWPLLQRAWGGVEPQALQRSVKVRLRAQTEAGALAPCRAANTVSAASSRNARKPLSAARDGDLPRLRRLRASCVAAPWPAARGSRRRCAQLPHRAAHRCAAPQRPEPARRGPGPVLRHRPGRADVSGPHPRHAPLAPSRSSDHPRSFVRSTP